MSVQPEDSVKKSSKKKSDSDMVVKKSKDKLEKADKVEKSKKADKKSKKVKDIAVEQDEDEIETVASPIISDNEDSVKDDKKKKKKEKKDKDSSKSKKKSKSKHDDSDDENKEDAIETSRKSMKHALSDSDGESEENQKPSKQFKPSNMHNVVFVSSIAFSTSDDELSDFFNDCGDIEKIRWIQSDHGRALVFFSSEEGVQNAVEKSGQQGPGGRYLSISEHHFNDWYDPKAVAVRVDSSYEETLKSALEPAGEIVSVTFHGDSALICFSTEEEADAAVALGRVSIGDQEMDARLATSKYHYGLERSSNFQDGGRGRGGFGGGRGGGRGGGFGGGRGGGFGGGRGGGFGGGRGGGFGGGRGGGFGGGRGGGFRGGRN